jgi:pimeloyl-ACP methyl ester carboxylesterase
LTLGAVAAASSVLLSMSLVLAIDASALAPDASGTALSQEAYARAGRLVRLPDGRLLNFRCTGSGSPTVLLEGGWAATSAAWYRVQPLVADHHRVCSYDRAGAGFSDPGPLPRDGAAIADDLDDGLRAAHIRGPLVVVGHSSGGMYARLFADRRTHDVIGMVLVDPSVEHQDARFSVAFGIDAGAIDKVRAHSWNCLVLAERTVSPAADPAFAPCLPKSRPGQSQRLQRASLAQALRPSTWRTQVSELDNLWSTTSKELDQGRQSYGAMPLIVLTADRDYAHEPRAWQPGLLAFWRRMHRQIADRSSRGAERLVANSSHLMVLDRPDAIAAAIDEVIAQARKSDPPPRKGGA